MDIAAVAALVKTLRQHPLLEPAQLQEVRRTLQMQSADPQALAWELVRRGWLTAYQAKLLLEGRARDLLLGSYVLLELLGEGGMGQVFKARQRKIGRIDAVKVVRPDRLGPPEALRRFRREIRAIAQLAHPNVIHAYDADEDAGRHYFAMEYLPGLDLARRVQRDGPLPFAEACEYARQAALGLQHAHERGLVHRDVKPSNLLVTPGGIVKVLDLGLARLTPGQSGDSTDQTLTADGAVMGTPDYIAPEQARQSHSVDGRADLYSLGCTLYFLLAGRPPFPNGPLTAKIAAHLFDEPEPLEQVRPGTPPSASAVVRRMMAKKPEDRYPSAGEAAAALGRVVAELVEGAEATTGSWTPNLTAPPHPTLPPRVGEGGVGAPAEAPPCHGQLAARATPPPGHGRGRTYAAAGAAVFLVVAGLAWAATALLTPRPPAPGNLVLDSADPDVRLTVRRKGKPDPIAEAKPGEALSLEPGDYDVELAADALAGLRLSAKEISVRPGERRAVRVEGEPLSPSALVSRPAAIDGVQSWTITTRIGRGAVERLAYSPNGRWLAAAQHDGVVRLLNAETGRFDHALVGHAGVVHALSWSGDKTNPLLATADDETVRVWEAGSGRVLLDRSSHVAGLALSPDGKTLACAVDNDVQLWDVASGKPGPTLKGHEQPVRAVAWSPDGTTLASAGDARTIRLWGPPPAADAPWPVEVRETTHSKPIRILVWSHDGKDLASGSDDGTVLVWPDRGKGGPTSLAVKDRLRGLAWSPDGRTLAAVNDLNSPLVHLWDARSGAPGLSIGGAGSGTAVAWSPDGNTVAAGNTFYYKGKRDSALKFWDPTTGEQGLPPLTAPPDRPLSLAWSPDGKTVAGDGGAHGVFLWDAAAGERKRALSSGAGDSVGPTAWAPDGEQIVSFWDRQLHRWNLGNGTAVDFANIDAVSRLAWSPRGTPLAGADRDSVLLWDAKTGLAQNPLEGHRKPVTALAWSADGSALATGDEGGNVLVREAANLAKFRTLSQPSRAMALAWSRDGKRLAAAGEDGAVRVWPRDGGAPVVLPGHAGGAHQMTWLADGTLVTTGADGRLRFWDPERGELKRAVRTDARNANFSPDGDRFVTGGDPWTLRLWQTATGRPLGTVVLLNEGWVVISEDGCYRCEKPGMEKELVFVVQTDRGQDTLTPEEFAAKHPWKNDPVKARLDTR